MSPQGRLALVLGCCFTFLCSTKHEYLWGLLWVILARHQLLILYRGGPWAPHLGEEKCQDSQSGFEGEPQGLLPVPWGTKHSTLSGLLWTLVIISHLITLTFMDDFNWAYKKQTVLSSGQVSSRHTEAAVFQCWMPTYPYPCQHYQ